MFKGKQQPSIDDMVAAYREFLEQKSGLESRITELKRDAALGKALGKTDLVAAVTEIHRFETQLSIADAGIQEIRQRLTQAVSDDLARNSQELAVRQAELQADMEGEAARAGKLCAELLGILDGLASPFGSRLARGLREVHEEICKPYRIRAGLYQRFAEAMLNAPLNTRDFKAEIAECATIGAAPEPGSAAFQRKVDLLVGRMLGDEEPPVRYHLPSIAAAG